MNYSLKIFKMVFLSLFLVLSFTSVYAQETKPAEYRVLAPLPGIGDANEEGEKTTTLQKYLPKAFTLTVAVAAALAFVMITFGGITYATSDSLMGRQDGKKYITNAIYGLLLVIGSYVILYTINPQILDFKLSIRRPEIDLKATIEAGGKTVAGYKLDAEEVAENARIKKELEDDGVTVNAGPCVNGETKGCTNLVGLPGIALAQVVKIKEQCNCTVHITGGAEGGHKTHGPGKAVIDLSNKDARLETFIKKNAFPREPLWTSVGPVYSVNIGGRGVSFLDEGATKGGGKGDHWHVIIN